MNELNNELRPWIASLDRRVARQIRRIDKLEMELRRIRMGIVFVACILLVAVITSCGTVANDGAYDKAGTTAPPTTDSWSRWTDLGRSTYFQCNGTTGVYIHDNFVQLLPLDPECVR